MTDQQQPTALGSVITDPRIRRWVYATWVVVSVVAGAITVGIAVLGSLPPWVNVMNAVLVWLGAQVTGLAVANTRTTRRR